MHTSRTCRPQSLAIIHTLGPCATSSQPWTMGDVQNPPLTTLLNPTDKIPKPTSKTSTTHKPTSTRFSAESSILSTAKDSQALSNLHLATTQYRSTHTSINAYFDHNNNNLSIDSTPFKNLFYKPATPHQQLVITGFRRSTMSQMLAYRDRAPSAYSGVIGAVGPTAKESRKLQSEGNTSGTTTQTKTTTSSSSKAPGTKAPDKKSRTRN
jgi:hypothetical protein